MKYEKYMKKCAWFWNFEYLMFNFWTFYIFERFRTFLKAFGCLVVIVGCPVTSLVARKWRFRPNSRRPLRAEEADHHNAKQKIPTLLLPLLSLLSPRYHPLPDGMMVVVVVVMQDESLPRSRRHRALTTYDMFYCVYNYCCCAAYTAAAVPLLSVVLISTVVLEEYFRFFIVLRGAAAHDIFPCFPLEFHVRVVLASSSSKEQQQAEATAAAKQQQLQTAH